MLPAVYDRSEPKTASDNAATGADDSAGIAGNARSAVDLAAAVRAGELSPRQSTDIALAAAEDAQRRLNAFISITTERARSRADSATGPNASRGPLAGVPLVVKDNLCVEGERTTAASRILEDFVPPYSATVVERLEAAGAIVVAKANMDEFGMGSTNENSAFGPVLNPHDPGRVAGGSSGGSAAAVAAGVAPLALGSDTGGSVRLPAAFCGVVGFKPTYGSLSRYGLISYASSLDQVGVLARAVSDVRLAFEALRGADPRDATSFTEPPLDRRPTSGPWRVGVIEELSGDGVSSSARAALATTIERLRADGVEVVTVSLPGVRYAVAAYYLIATAEASSNLARYDGTIYGARVEGSSSGAQGAGQEQVMTLTRGTLFGREVRRRVLMGSFALSAGYYDAYYGRALKVRRLLADAFHDAFGEVDALLSPTAVGPAYELGEKLADPVAMYVGDIATCLANLGGLPAISVPAGRDDQGLPLGVQLMGRAGADDELLAGATRLESLLA